MAFTCCMRTEITTASVCSSRRVCVCNVFVRFRVEQPVYINIIRDPINRFLSNYFFRRFGDWRGEQNHLIRTPGMKDDERYLVRKTPARSASGVTRMTRVSSSSNSNLETVCMTCCGSDDTATSHSGRSLSPLGLRSFTSSACLSPSSVSFSRNTDSATVKCEIDSR